MNKPKLTIFYQFDPWGPSIGGIQTVIRSFIKYTPDCFDLQVVGLTSDAGCTPGHWQTASLVGRMVRFLPLFFLADDNVRHRVPTSVRYTAALIGKRIRSDFLHFHRLEPSLAALGWSGEKTLFIHNDVRKQIAQAHGKNALWQRLPGAYFALERSLVGQFDQLLSCNRESAAFYCEQYADLAERVLYYKNMVDNETFFPLEDAERDRARQLLARQMGLSEATRFVLFAGRLHGQKDPLRLVRAFARVAEPETHLLIAGAGELEAQVRSEIEHLNLTNRATLLGPVAQERLADLHRLASAFVLTSDYEGLPMVALEALACGTPVVTTRAGETPHLLSLGSGLVAADFTPEAVATALTSVLKHPEHYAARRCILAAHPYGAQAVVGDLCAGMLRRWENRRNVAALLARRPSLSLDP